MRQVWVGLVVATLALAGCVQSLTSTPDDVERTGTAAAEWALHALTSEHDHTDPALHRGLSTANFETIGWTPLISEEYGTTVPGALCGDAQPTEDGRQLAAVQGRTDVVFTLADVTDPTAPEWLGEFVMRSTYVYDLAVVPDGKHVVLVTSDVRQPDKSPVLLDDAVDVAVPAGDGLYWRSPCAPGGLGEWHRIGGALPGEDLLPRPNSVILVDVQDPANPVVADQRPLTGLGHSVQSTLIDGFTWVVTSALSAHGPGQQFAFWEVADTPTGAKLVLLSAYAAPLPPAASDMTRIGGHNDAWLAKHPGTGDSLAYLATNYEFIILDMSDPHAPRQVGVWTDWDPERPNDTGHFHSAFPLGELWDGRHFTVVGPEFGGKPDLLPTGVVYVLETTDPANPRLAGAWTLPHDVVWEGRLMWSPHYLSVSGKTAFVSMYHGGAWALDLAPVLQNEFTLLDAVGAYLPVNESPNPPETPIRWAPTLEEVIALPDGTLVTFDSNSGLYAFRFDESRPMAPPEPWKAELPDVVPLRDA